MASFFEEREKAFKNARSYYGFKTDNVTVKPVEVSRGENNDTESFESIRAQYGFGTSANKTKTTSNVKRTLNNTNTLGTSFEGRSKPSAPKQNAFSTTPIPQKQLSTEDTQKLYDDKVQEIANLYAKAQKRNAQTEWNVHDLGGYGEELQKAIKEKNELEKQLNVGKAKDYYNSGKDVASKIKETTPEVNALLDEYIELKRNSEVLGMNGSNYAMPLANERIKVSSKIKDLMGWSEKEFTEVAEQYEYVKNQEDAAKREAELTEYSKDNPVLASVWRTANNVASGLGAADILIQKLENRGTDKPIDTNAYLNTWANEAQIAEEAVLSTIDNDFGKAVYSTAMGMVDSMIMAGISAGVGGMFEAPKVAETVRALTTDLIMGSSVATREFKNNIEKGYNENEALMSAFLKGAIEGVTEAVSIEKILGEVKKGEKLWKMFLKSGATEAQEELASNWLGRVVDVVIDGGEELRNAYKENFDNAIADGKDKKEAFFSALWNTVGKEDLTTAFLSFLSGGIMGSGFTAVSRVPEGISKVAEGASKLSDNVSALEEIRKNYGNYQRNDTNRNNMLSLIEEGKTFEEGSRAYNKANSLEDKMRSGKNISAMNIQSVINEYARARNNTENNAQNTRALTPTEASESGLNVANEINRNVSPAPTRPNVANIDNTAVAEKNRRLRPTGAQIMGADGRGEPVAVNLFKDVDKGEVYISNGETKTLGQVAFDDDAQRDLYFAATEKGYDTETANAMLQGYSDTPGYTEAFDYFYKRGTTGESFDFEGSAHSTQINSIVAHRAFALGRQKLEQNRSSAMARQNSRTVKEADGGVYFTRDYTQKRENELSKKQKSQLKLIEEYANEHKVRVSVVASLGNRRNGMYDPNTDTITISLDARANAYIGFFSHELLHRIKAQDINSYHELLDEIINNYLSKDPKFDLEGRIREVQALYKKEAKQELSREEAIEEIVANSVIPALSDRQFIESIVENKKTLAEKINEWVNELINELNKILDRLSNIAEVREVRKDVQLLENIRNIIDESVSKTGGIREAQGESRNTINELDSEYMAAVESGNVAEQQRLVNEAAERAGYTVDGYHGTPNNDFTVFDKERIGKGIDQYGAGFYFATDKDSAKSYGSRVINAVLKIESPIRIDATSEYGANLIDAGEDFKLTKNQAYQVIKHLPNIYDSEESPLGDYFEEYWESGAKDWMIRALAEQYRNIGYLDSDLFREHPNELHEALKEVVGYDGIEVTHKNGEKFYVAWFDNQMKSSDPITYDDNGEVIPLSKRFNLDSNNIRYSADKYYKHLDEKFIDDVDFDSYPSVKLSKAEYNRVYSAAMTYHSKRSKPFTLNLYSKNSNISHTYLVWFDNDYNLKILDAYETPNINEKGDVFDERFTDRERLNRLDENYWKRKRLHNSRNKLAKNGRKQNNNGGIYNKKAESKRESDGRRNFERTSENNKGRSKEKLSINEPDIAEIEAEVESKVEETEKIRKVADSSFESLLTIKDLNPTEQQKKRLNVFLETERYLAMIDKNIAKLTAQRDAELDGNKATEISKKLNERYRERVEWNQRYNERLAEPEIQELIKKSVNIQLAQLIEEYGSIKPGFNPVREIAVPKRTSPNKKVRQTVRTILESGAITDDMIPDISKEVFNETFSYVPVSDEEAKNYAEKYLEKYGYEAGMQAWESALRGDKRITKNDIAIAEYLLQQAANDGNVKDVLKLSAELSAEGTRAGQTAQAISLLKKLGTPEVQHLGQLYYIQKAVDNLNKDIEKQFKKKIAKGKVSTVKIDEALAEDLLNAETETEYNLVVDKIIKNVADQMPSTWVDKWNAWRYLAMLGNVRTHTRNIIGNALFVPAIETKNFVASLIEKGFVKKSNKTKSIVVDKAYRDFASDDFAKVKDYIISGSRYDELGTSGNITTRIKENKKVFNTKWLETARKTNSRFLENEDIWFLSYHYKRALSQYLQANHAAIEGLTEGSVMLEKARAYAIAEAQKATYRDFSATAQAINQIANRSSAARFALNSILPFRSTPINILKRGIEYSPMGLATTLGRAWKQYQAGVFSSTDLIDGLSAGLVGTAAMAMGALLYHLGAVQPGYDDEDEERFDELQGGQEYSLKIGDVTYTFDWAAPMSLPFFLGAQLDQVLRDEDGLEAKEIFDVLSMITEPMFELSMLEGLNNTIEAVSYEGQNKLAAIGLSLLSSYLQQAVPTMFGQVARIFDSKTRSTYIDKNSPLPDEVQRFYQQVIAKVPFVATTKNPYINAWGEEKKESILFRILENTISPGYFETYDTNDVEKELEGLYEATNEKSVLPKTAQKYFNVNKERKDLTSKEYVAFASIRGQTAYETLTDLFNVSAYNKLTDEQKVDAVENAYLYANEKAKMSISSDYTASEKWIIEAEEAYERSGLPIEMVILSKALTADITSDKDEDGNTISGSKKEKVLKSINSMNLTRKQKDELYYIYGYGKKDIDKAPWN